jgi:hypothetical protein
MEMSANRWAVIKRAVFNHCMEIVFAGVKQASHDGLCLKDPWGVERCVFPRLMSYVADEPELKMVTCIKGVPSAHPCETCMVCAACCKHSSQTCPLGAFGWDRTGEERHFHRQVHLRKSYTLFSDTETCLQVSLLIWASFCPFQACKCASSRNCSSRLMCSSSRPSLLLNVGMGPPGHSCKVPCQCDGSRSAVLPSSAITALLFLCTA